MKIVIVGDGKVGRSLIELLSEEGHNITVIEIEKKRVESLVNDYDVIGFCGNGGSFSVMEQAGVKDSDIFISVTGSDELNIMSCLVAGKLGAKRTVARVRNPEYSAQVPFMREKLGLNLVINPEMEVANEIARFIEFPSAMNIETFAKGRIELAEIVVSEDSVLCGMKLMELRKKLDVPVLVCAVRRGEEVIIPSGSFVIEAGDRVHFSAPHKALPKIFKTLGLAKKKIKSVLIVGGSRTAFYLAKRLSAAGMDVKLIEQNPEKAAHLEENLDNVTVICGDGTDHELLSEERISDFDAAVALTQIDEENLIFSMYAESQGVEKTVSKVNRVALIKMLVGQLKNSNTVTPKNVTARTILRYVRAVSNADGSEMRTLYQILDGKAEAMEFIASENCKLNGIPLKNLNLKPNIIIACVSRGHTVLIPDGNTEINKGDSVIVITAGQRIVDLNEILL